MHAADGLVVLAANQMAVQDLGDEGSERCEQQAELVQDLVEGLVGTLLFIIGNAVRGPEAVSAAADIPIATALNPPMI